MTQRRSGGKTPAGAEDKAGRAERLASELRANLRRRKEQARARGGAEADPATGRAALEPGAVAPEAKGGGD